MLSATLNRANWALQDQRFARIFIRTNAVVSAHFLLPHEQCLCFTINTWGAASSVLHKRSTNHTYDQMRLPFTMAFPVSSSTGAVPRNLPTTRHAASVQVRGAATYRLWAADLGGLDQAIDLCAGGGALGRIAEQPGFAPNHKGLYPPFSGIGRSAKSQPLRSAPAGSSYSPNN